MSRTMIDGKAAKEATSRAWQRARQTATDAKPVVAAQVKPLADNTKVAASRGVHKARKWAAPQVDRTGQAIQDTVAPKVAAALAEYARRLDPDKPKGGRWRKIAGIAVVLAAAGAIAVVLRSRTSSAMPETSDDDMPVPESKADANAEVKDPARTS